MINVIKFMINIISGETNRLYFIHSCGAINGQIEQLFKRDFDVEKMKSLKYVICVLR